MRVFHFISHFDLGGAERVAANIAKSKMQGVEHHIVEMMRGNSDFTSQFISELEQAGVKCHRAWMPDIRWHFVIERLTALLFPIRFLMIWLRWHPDVIHTHTELPDLCTVAAMKAWPWIGKRIRIVRTIHNNCLWTGQKRLGNICEHFFQKHHSNISISNSVRASYLENYGKDTPIIYNGVGEVMQKWYEQLVADRTNVIFAGRFESQKGINTLVKVISMLKDDQQYYFHLFGEGSLQGYIMENLGRQSNVSINPPLYGLASYLGSFDYMFMPSEFEGLSIVAIEASINHLPNIINSCLGLEETLPEDWPLKVKNNSVEEYIKLFSATIPHLERATLAKQAYTYANSHFSIEQMRAGYEASYKQNL